MFWHCFSKREEMDEDYEEQNEGDIAMDLKLQHDDIPLEP